MFYIHILYHFHCHRSLFIFSYYMNKKAFNIIMFDRHGLKMVKLVLL